MRSKLTAGHKTNSGEEKEKKEERVAKEELKRRLNQKSVNLKRDAEKDAKQEEKNNVNTTIPK